MREIKGKAILYAFNKSGVIVYSQIIGLDDYYDGNHVWDSWEKIKSCGIVRLVGILFASSGDIQKEFENTYDEQTGEMTGTRNYSYREHLKTDEKYQKALARFQELREKRSNPSA